MIGHLFLTRQLFYGAAVATLVGLGMGAWLEPPQVPRADADPYADVVLNLPQDQSAYAAYPQTAAGWLSSIAPGFTATDAAWSREDSRDLYPTEPLRPLPAEPATIQTAAYTPSEPEPAPPPRASRWPSEGGDILDIGTPESPPRPAPVASQPSADAEDVAAAGETQRAGFQMIGPPAAGPDVEGRDGA